MKLKEKSTKFIIFILLMAFVTIFSPAYAVNNSYISEEAAAKIVRDAMIEREPYAYVHIEYTPETLADICMRIFGLAVSENYAVGSSAGDYLNCSYKSYGWVEMNRDGRVDIRFRFFYYTTAEEEKEVNRKVASTLSSIGAYSGSDYNKIKKIYSWVTKNVKFDPYSGEHQYTAYGAVNGKAVCQGYSTLIYKMCKEVGLNVRIVSGPSHVWNVVKIDGKWYYLDATWDEGYSENNWYNFLKGSLGNHTLDANGRKIINSLNMATSDYVPPKPAPQLQSETNTTTPKNEPETKPSKSSATTQIKSVKAETTTAETAEPETTEITEISTQNPITDTTQTVSDIPNEGIKLHPSREFVVIYSAIGLMSLLLLIFKGKKHTNIMKE